LMKIRTVKVLEVKINTCSRSIPKQRLVGSSMSIGQHAPPVLPI